MCYDIQTSIASFLSVTITGIVALRIRQPIIGCLMLSYGAMQLSEIIIWRGVDTDNPDLNRVGTTIGKYTLPSHNLAIGVGVLIAYWGSRHKPIYWIPLTVGVLFYIGVMIRYATKKDENNGLTKACKYPEDEGNCTRSSARLEWPYPHSWYAISFIISIILTLVFIRPLVPTAVLAAIFYGGTFFMTYFLGKRQVLGSYWCWSTAAFAPVLLLMIYILQKS